MQNEIDHPEVLKLLNAGIIVVAVICLVLAIFGLFGAAKLTLQVPDNATIYINGHAYSHDETLTLRPATYNISIAAPLYQSATTDLKLSFFSSKTISKDSFKQRKADNILRSAIGSYGFYGPPAFAESKLFEDNTWLAGLVGPSTATPIALHFASNKWNVAYFDIKSYDSDPSVLPADVAAYMQTLEAQTGSQ